VEGTGSHCRAGPGDISKAGVVSSRPDVPTLRPSVLDWLASGPLTILSVPENFECTPPKTSGSKICALMSWCSWGSLVLRAGEIV
jgi:hypothetical protein